MAASSGTWPLAAKARSTSLATPSPTMGVTSASENGSSPRARISRLIAAARSGTEFTSDYASVPAGRRFVAARLDDWACPHMIETATLLTSEILTNAVVHGLGPVRLRLHRTDTEVAVIVSDRSRNLPQPRLAGPTDESGRGLNLPDVLATSWGARATADGKDVWFTLAV